MPINIGGIFKLVKLVFFVSVDVENLILIVGAMKVIIRKTKEEKTWIMAGS